MDAQVCSYFGLCGGCTYHHDQYHSSVEKKSLEVLNLFSPILTPQTFLKETIPCSPPFHYRNKMEFSFFQTIDGKKSLGLMSSSKPKHAVSINSCLIGQKSFISCLDIVRAWWKKNDFISAYFPPLNKGSLISLTIRESSVNGDLLIILTSSGKEIFQIPCHIVSDLFDALLSSSLPITSIIWEEKLTKKGSPTAFIQKLSHGPGFLWQKLPSATSSRECLFKVRAKSFFQPNTKQTAFIPKIIAEFVPLTGSEHILDLYCGAGTLGITLADGVKSVSGIEIIPDAVESARENISINQLQDKATVSLGDVKTFCKALSESSQALPDLVILDPPRCGLQAKTLKNLLRIAPPKIAYVSCNPKTQFEEAKVLIEYGYAIQAMGAVDQFPFSDHIENILYLEKL